MLAPKAREEVSVMQNGHNGHHAATIATLRRQLGMTQEEFAHSIGVTVSTVNRWENGHIQPSRLARKAMEKLAQHTAVSGALDSAASAAPTRYVASPAE